MDTGVDYKDIINLDDEIIQKLGSEHRDSIVKSIYNSAETISSQVITRGKDKKIKFDDKVDNLLTSKWLGFPIMIFLLGLVFWITIAGANVPSSMLASMFEALEVKITGVFMYFNSPEWLHGILVLGIFRTLGWVISVMLPPMAIFFPLFTLMEDLGYLPRVAFNLDKLFKRAGAHGKQSLTMSMGFGCNAAGVIACRIIESPRERLIAILTNNFVPCNGRFPTLIALSSMFIGGLTLRATSSLISALFVTFIVLIGIMFTLIASSFLSKTFLKGVPSTFTLELPPYRKPKILRVLYTSLIDRTIFVLGRAIVVAAPAGAVLWILANVMIGNVSVLTYIATLLQPFAQLIGLDGYILTAFIIGLPANEIVVPIIIMSYMSKGAMLELDSLVEMKKLFIENGWTVLTAINTMLFSLLHFPCGTTIWTIRKETGSNKWTLLSVILPTVVAIVVCFITATIARAFFGF